MTTLNELIEEPENKEEKLLIKYSDSTKDILIFPKDVKGDPALEKLLHLKVHTVGDLFKVFADEQPLLFENFTGDIKNDCIRVKAKITIYDSKHKEGGTYVISKNALVSLRDIENYMLLEITEKNGEYILDVNSQQSSL